MSSHASTATITLGGAVRVTSQPQQQNYNAPAQPASQAVDNHRRRKRQNVPAHMQQSTGQPAAYIQQSGGQPVAHIQQSTGQPAAHVQQSRGQPVAHIQQSTGRSTAKPRYGGAMPFGTVYKTKGPLQSSTPDQAYQTQTLFNDASPAPRQQGGVRYIERPMAPAPAPAPAPHIPAPIEMSALDQQRALEARAKLKEMNISAELVEQYRRRFNVLDLNKDGVVNLREFAAISRVLGYKFSKEEILEIFGRKDIDDSGGISFDEFVLAMYERSQRSKELAPYREKFRIYDWKDKGYITSDEAYPILKKELGFDENKTEMLIDMYDRNRDYRLSILEFIEFYKRVEELKVQVHNAFRDFDRNGDGFVDAAEAKAVLGPKGFTDQQVEALIFKYDKDADGRLNFLEFAAFWDVQIV